MKKFIFAIVFVCFSWAQSAFALGPTSFVVLAPDAAQSQTRTSGYAGLSWTFGSHKPMTSPDIVVGVRAVKVQPSDRVSNGADLSIRLTTSSGLSLDNTRLSYVAGDRSLLGNFGMGYSYSQKSFLATAAVQAPYSRLGMDYSFSPGRFSPTLELITLDRPQRPALGQKFLCSPSTNFSLPENPVVGQNCYPTQ